MSNKRRFAYGRKKAERLIENAIFRALFAIGRHLINDAEAQAEYRNLTGNLITSLSFGLYVNHSLREVMFIDGKKAPLRVKLTKGESVYKFMDYDGGYRSYFTADADSDGGYGSSSVIRFFRSYNPRRPFEVVISTGAEYAVFLERELGLNVLTDTHLVARTVSKRLIKQHMKI